jgi:hypothetical protein
MTTYADPTRCPECRAMLSHDPQVCRVCALPLSGETANRLFATFQEADRLLGVLRAQRRPAPATVGATVTPGSLLVGVEPFPAAPEARPRAGSAPHRVTGASVPKILLSLGALCLLVAAVTFLAVAWHWLGVGGRTVVLVGLTGTALGLSASMHRHRLRMAAEALSVIGLGLLALDVIGLDHAGWLGRVDDPQLALLTGAVVTTGALLMLAATSRRPLVAPALIAPVAALTAGAGAQVDVHAPVPMLVTLVVLLGLARLGTILRSLPLQITSLGTAGLGWLYLVASGIELAGTPVTLHHFVAGLAVWPLVAATLLAAAVGPVTGVRRSVAVAGYAVAGLVGSYTLLLPALDNGATPLASAVLVVSGAWTVALVTAPQRLRPAVLLPLGGTLVVPVVAALALLSEAARAVATVGSPFSKAFDVRVAARATEVSPLLLLPSLVVVAAVACGALGLVGPVRRLTWALALVGAAALGAVATLPLYDVPLAAVVAALTVGAVGAVVAGERLPGATADLSRLASLALITGAALIALPNDRLTTVVLAVACTMAVYLMPRTDETGAVAALCFPIAFAGLAWAALNVAGVDPVFRALPVLLVLGGLAIWRPQLDLEVSAAFSATAICVASVADANDVYAALAIHLTVAGVLVTASSIIHPSRRPLAWVGGVLLAAATWVRLVELGVHVPEAYTLPSALVLVAVGAWRLRQDDESATLTYLTPGLTLATVPSLLAMLEDPFSLRALLLGVACLVLTVGGAAVRWSAPVAVGATVGTLLVLRELAPYAAQVPTWLTIGVSGAVLLTVGITWESRMNDVRRASHYLTALR